MYSIPIVEPAFFAGKLNTVLFNGCVVEQLFVCLFVLVYTHFGRRVASNVKTTLIYCDMRDFLRGSSCALNNTIPSANDWQNLCLTHLKRLPSVGGVNLGDPNVVFALAVISLL